MIGGIWWFIRWRRRRGDDYDYPRGAINDDSRSPEMSNATMPAYYSSRSTYSRGRDAGFRSIPREVTAVSSRYGIRGTRASSTIRHSTVSPSKMKKPLTTIPEAPLHETSLPRQTCGSPVQDRLESESLPSLHNNDIDVNDEQESEAWNYAQPVTFASIT